MSPYSNSEAERSAQSPCNPPPRFGIIPDHVAQQKAPPVPSISLTVPGEAMLPSAALERDYKPTLHLPKTAFPMRANLPQTEPETLARWAGLYDQIQQQRAGRPKYILHDGPPYANGHIHIGHALNKILKDIIVRFQTLSGRSAPYVPGWDCHGLPIEHQVLTALGAEKVGMSQLDIRKRCREYAERFVAIQRGEFQRLGVLGDWDHSYLTMTPDYEAEIVRQFGKVVAAGGVYKGKKPVLWCPHDETALAEAEVEYADHATPSVYVRFPVTAAGGGWRAMAPASTPVSLVIWTTTPWTLPANQALCLHPDFDYRLLQVGDEVFVVAENRVAAVAAACGWQTYHRLGVAKGRDLEGTVCRRPFSAERPSHVILGQFVTLDQGTGIVHIAPGHGHEDFIVAEAYNAGGTLPAKLEIMAPVDARGRFTDEVADPRLVGQKVFDANATIIQRLTDLALLLGQETLTHSYPHCWRCKQPVIVRATEQWFISMEKTALRERAVAAIRHNVAWVPKWGEDRIMGMVAARPDWCISRQRAWGVPIVAFSCLACRTPLYSQAIANHVADQMAATGEGGDLWFSRPAEALLPAGTVCGHCGGDRFTRESDILDVWFESGVSHAAVLQRRADLAWPADLYLEGSDQHRGWFHSALLVSLETDGRPPYRSVLTHGFTVDGAGKKMSKSAGNVVAPQAIIDRYGAEILRLWVAATDFRDDLRISDPLLIQLSEAYRKIRNTCRFLLGNLAEDDSEAPVPEGERPEIDRWALHRLDRLNARIQSAYAAFEFHIVFHAINHFCAVDLSAVYLDVIKDRLYAGDARTRRAAQATLAEIVVTLTQWLAPILPFTADEIWNAIPPRLRPSASVHLSEFPTQRDRYADLAEPWERLLAVREAVTRSLETARAARQIGSSLAARVTLSAAPPLFDFLKKRADDLPALFIVSQVDLAPSPDATSDSELAVTVDPARGEKCVRCWVYHERVGADTDHPALCPRCVEVVCVAE